MTSKWQFWVDRGGTFTDIVAQHPDGTLSSHKYLSEHPERYKDAAVFAIREIMAVPTGEAFPSHKVEAIKMGTTVATNALLEQRGEPTLLVVTKGFRDALLIGQQHRSDLFALQPSRPKPLYEQVVEVNERIRADGTVDIAFSPQKVSQMLHRAYQAGIRSCAITLVHGYRYPEHEKQTAAIAKEIGFEQISVSHQVSPLMKFVSRGDTTLADAYLSPVLLRYVEQIRSAVGETPLFFMQSNGGLAKAGAFKGKDAALSGPAGGIVAAAEMAKATKRNNIIGFDMGGTSTDVSHYAGHYERVLDTVVAGVRMTVPMMDIHTVAAGGGSVCSFSQGRYLVGPQSAGANPGPAAYGRGGPITVTDCNVLLGKLQPELFPQVFGRNGDQPLDLAATKRGFQLLAKEIEAHTGTKTSLEAIAKGFLSVAVEHMARAIKKVSVQRGHDIKNHALLSFGGAGGQHACLVAEALGITEIIIPPFSGVLSALGMGLAKMTTIADQFAECPYDDTATLSLLLQNTCDRAQRQLAAQGIPLHEQTVSQNAHLRYANSNTTIAIAYNAPDIMKKAFETAHQQQFGFYEERTSIIVQSLEVEASNGHQSPPTIADEKSAEAACSDGLPMQTINLAAQIPSFQKSELVPEQVITGPATILENGGTTTVEPGWQSECLSNGTLILNQIYQAQTSQIDSNKPDPVLLEIFNNLFMSVAEEMGGVLAKTAHSVNIKERLDFSCAVFDSKGQLIANAPHMPVHLGSMGESVIAVLEARGRSIRCDDVYMVNDPYAGGTHLPDITVISPVFVDKRDTPSFFVASRGHHADVGGITPGSMPPNSRIIEDEGIRFTNFKLVSNGTFNEAAVRAALTNNPNPARNPDQNIADLKAQVAANKRGCMLVLKLVDHYGYETVQNYMQHVQDNAEEAVRQVIAKLKPGSFNYPMDCGGEVAVKILPNTKSRSVTIDFTGTSAALENNFNAPLSVTKAAVLYVFRTLTKSDIPLNAGCLKPIKLIVPVQSMLNPSPPSAVVAGNVETSQIVTNALFLATGALAASQGTMNNLTFGNDQYQYYETIAGGTGAGPDFDGVDAIQSHMTNSRLTDAEVLEWRYPVVVENFAIRHGSGGNGQNHGGNGAIRTIRFLQAMNVSILSGHRANGPFGMDGGQKGLPGRTFICRLEGTTEELQATDSAFVEAGESITIMTPGGGGYGVIDN